MRIQRVFLSLITTIAGLLRVSQAARSVNSHHGSRWHMFMPGRHLAAPEGIHNAIFEQLIDHANPRLGTFKQRYWYDAEHWGGPGHPVVLFNAGEVNASAFTGYCTNETISGMLAQRIKAAAIVIEHRYWGDSSPFPTLTTENMQYLTLENNMQDMVYFAKTVQLPFDTQHKSNADTAPWILVGGSYPGALAAYIASAHPGTFWAYLASSAPVQVISDFWQYFYPVQQGLPKNCTFDVVKVIDYMDNILENGSADEVLALKTEFGLEQVEHNDDFMSALENAPWLWQESSLTAPNQALEWCDYIENAVNTTTNASLSSEGVGLDRALEGYARYMREVQIPGFCEATGYFEGENNTECYGTYNASNPMFTDTSLRNTINRQWMWMLCNEPFGFWQDGGPSSRPSLVSRLVNAQYWIRQCGLYFPPGPQGQTYGIAQGRTESEVNARTDGWNMLQTRPLDRIVMTNGEFDPWRSASSASEFRPGGPDTLSNDRIMTNIIPGGVHCYDLTATSGTANEGVAKVQQAEIDQIAKWVAEWPGY